VQRVDCRRAAIDLGLHGVETVGDGGSVARLPRHELLEHVFNAAVRCCSAGSVCGT
jgi:hypothetical protein